MPKILIIEDEAAIRRVLSKILSEENDTYEVEDAEDGVAGFEKIKNNDYDLGFVRYQNAKNGWCRSTRSSQKNKTRNSDGHDFWSW